MTRKVSEQVLEIMRRFVESRGYEFPESHTYWNQGGRYHPWSVIRDVDGATGNCYGAWCERHKKAFNKIQNLKKFVSSERQSEFAIGKWVLWMPWFPHAHRYGEIIDLRPCNHSEDLYPVVRWLDGSVSFASADFCEVVLKPYRLSHLSVASRQHQLSLLEVSA